MNEKDEKKLKKDYKKGLTYKELCKKYDITHNKLIVFIRKNKLTRNKSENAKGNKNATGNKGGAPPKNKNAVVTGAYETIIESLFDENEKVIYNTNQEKIDIKKKIQQEIAILEIREKRILERINEKKKAKEMSVSSMSSSKNSYHYGSTAVSPTNSTNTTLEPTINVIQRLEEALTKVQETKRRYIETFAKLPNDDEDDEEDNSFIDALKGLTKEIWDEEE